MNGPIAYGIDFGTTNSSIGVAYADRVELIDVSRHGIPELMPSVVFFHRSGQRSAGEEAIQQFVVTGAHRTKCWGCDLVERFRGQVLTDCKQYVRGGFCQDARIAAELKAELASSEFTKTHSWATDFDLPELIAVVIRQLKRAADRVTGRDVRRAVIGFPVAFEGAEGPDFERRQRLALERLTDAAERSGLDEVELLEEPAAAVVDEQLEDGLVVTVDFGGGTFDVAVVRLRPDQGEVMALQGASIGGERFTAALFDAKVAPSLGLDRGVPAWFRLEFRSLGGVLHLLSNRLVPSILRDLKGRDNRGRAEIVEGILYGGHAYHFYRAIEQAKIDLSISVQTAIEFHRPGIDLSIPVARSEFEALIEPDLQVVGERIHAALNQADIQPSDVDAVLRTGGSSSIPAFVRLLENTFGPSKIHERPAFTTIVRGLAAHARGRWAA